MGQGGNRGGSVYRDHHGNLFQILFPSTAVVVLSCQFIGAWCQAISATTVIPSAPFWQPWEHYKMKRTQASIDKMIATRKRNKEAERARDTAWINGNTSHERQHEHQHAQQMPPKPQQQQHR